MAFGLALLASSPSEARPLSRSRGTSPRPGYAPASTKRGLMENTCFSHSILPPPQLVALAGRASPTTRKSGRTAAAGALAHRRPRRPPRSPRPSSSLSCLLPFCLRACVKGATALAKTESVFSFPPVPSTKKKSRTRAFFGLPRDIVKKQDGISNCTTARPAGSDSFVRLQPKSGVCLTARRGRASQSAALAALLWCFLGPPLSWQQARSCEAGR